MLAGIRGRGEWLDMLRVSVCPSEIRTQPSRAHRTKWMNTSSNSSSSSSTHVPTYIYITTINLHKPPAHPLPKPMVYEPRSRSVNHIIYYMKYEQEALSWQFPVHMFVLPHRSLASRWRKHATHKNIVRLGLRSWAEINFTPSDRFEHGKRSDAQDHITVLYVSPWLFRTTVSATSSSNSITRPARLPREIYLLVLC